MRLATNAEVEEVVSQLAEVTARLVELLLVDDQTVASSTTSIHCEDITDESSSISSERQIMGTNAMIKLKENKPKIEVGNRVMVVRRDEYYG